MPVFHLNRVCVCLCVCREKEGHVSSFPFTPDFLFDWIWTLPCSDSECDSAPVLSHARQEKADLTGLLLQRYLTGQLGVSQRWPKGRPSPWVSLQRPASLPQLLSYCIRPCQVTKISTPNTTQIQSPTYSFPVPKTLTYTSSLSLL